MVRLDEFGSPHSTRIRFQCYSPVSAGVVFSPNVYVLIYTLSIIITDLKMYYAGASWWSENGRWLDNHRPGVNQYPPHDITPYIDRISNEDFIEIYRLHKIGLRHFEEEVRKDPLISRSTKRGLQPAPSSPATGCSEVLCDWELCGEPPEHS
jgi:hypothetical protein